MGKAPNMLWKTKDSYEEDPSMKLSSLVLICLQHLNVDNWLPLMVDPKMRNGLSQNGKEYLSCSIFGLFLAHRSAVSDPDKIVVYACFPITEQRVRD